MNGTRQMTASPTSADTLVRCQNCKTISRMPAEAAEQEDVTYSCPQCGSEDLTPLPTSGRLAVPLAASIGLALGGVVGGPLGAIVGFGLGFIAGAAVSSQQLRR
jgi:predicted RNA-binding Zn-ribbon protein involved in translation (DUF1610 family)